MLRTILPTTLLLAILAASCPACLRPDIDERAVQWSTAIVEAKLVKAGEKTTLGQLQERQGARGALGIATTTYFYRQYDFEVTRPMDGPYKKGDHIPVLRLFMTIENPPGICSQHLTKAAVGKEFLLLLRPLSQFELVWPNVVKKPDVKGAMIVVHLQPEEAGKSLPPELGTTIVETRADAKQATPKRIQAQIAALQSAPDDAKAAPAIEALSRMGPAILPDLQQAVSKSSGPAQTRIYQLMADLALPDPVMKTPDDEPERR
jgi:hypothetical protein